MNFVVGFLLTAVRAWTSLETPRGASLAWLWLLWAAGRACALLRWMKNDATPESECLPIELVVRGTSGPPAA